jgi:thiol-disulfide isomerase/thioredoxin
MRAEQGGRVTFSALYNRFESDEEPREYLAQLYEVFFAIPGYLGSRFSEDGQIPSVKQLGSRFGLPEEGIRLLLEVMESDSRMPPILVLDEKSGEIESVDLKAVAEFTGERGGEVKLRGWKGRSLPEFSLPMIEGQQMSGSDLAGKATLIVIWLTGCPDCRRTLPNIVRLRDEYGGRRFRVIGFNVDKALGLDRTDSDRREFAESLGLNFPSLLLDEETRARFGNLNIYPTLIFVSSGGIIERLVFNFQEYEVLEDVTVGLLSEDHENKVGKPEHGRKAH